jgi:copper(I)-binding protein
MRLARLPILFAGLFAAAAVHAHEFKLGAITVVHPYARFTVAGQKAGGGFMSIENKGAADRLVAASTPASERVELHTMRMEGDVMRMRQVEGIDVPAGKTVELAPGGHHLMLMGLKAPLTVGTPFALTLRFQRAGEVTVQVEVENPPPWEAEQQKAKPQGKKAQ